MRFLLTLSFFLSLGSFLSAQHTFSIVAVDVETGEVGSAGATCLTSADCGGCGGAVIISDLVPGRGAMNAQATVCIPNSNLNTGIVQMQIGDAPDEVLAYVLANDNCAFGDTGDRQYGIVDISPDGEARSTAYTGGNALDYANHIIGPNYAIQGNILLGQEVLDGMEAGFLNTEGSLAEKLMGAMQGANIPGADIRCLDDGLSSESSFLRVAVPEDIIGPSLDLIVGATLPGVDPIDSLQTLFDEYLVTVGTQEVAKESWQIQVFPNPTTDAVVFRNLTGAELQLRLLNLVGQVQWQGLAQKGDNSLNLSELEEGQLYLLEVRNGQNELVRTLRLLH